MLERICGRKPGFFAAFAKEIKDFFFSTAVENRTVLPFLLK